MNKPTLSLGKYDASTNLNPQQYLFSYHAAISSGITAKNTHFRDENINTWKPFTAVAGPHIKETQAFLKETGFLFSKEPDGIFGYETLSAVRLFQEYMRTVDNKGGIPDGYVGKNTYAMMDWWRNSKNGEIWINDWGRAEESADYDLWMDVLRKGKAHYQANPSPQIRTCEGCASTSDTLNVNDWDVSKDAVHLIGIRRKQKHGFHLRAENRDLYALVLYGMVFYFWGSTVPNLKHAGNKNGQAKNAGGFPFLFEGQHKYRFAWHMIGDKTKVYKALRPASKGILVYRMKDHDKDGIIESQEEMTRGLDKHPNSTINIHWSGRGFSSFSAGCQVIAGSSYINHLGKVVNCMDFAGINSGDLNRASKTKGAYNMLADLILTYSKPGLPHVNYTLFREEDLVQFSNVGGDKISGMVNQMRRCLHTKS